MIRKAIKKDIEDINELLFQVHKVHSDVRPDLFKKGCKKYNNNELFQIIDDNNKPIFVYEEDGKILGYAFCILIDNYDKLSLADYTSIYIDDLCVDEKARGRHIGKKLYDYVLDYAKTQGCYNVTLNVWSDNKNAFEFYEKMGMHIQKYGMEKILK